jgi:hypothetical protein
VQQDSDAQNHLPTEDKRWLEFPSTRRLSALQEIKFLTRTFPGMGQKPKIVATLDAKILIFNVTA